MEEEELNVLTVECCLRFIVFRYGFIKKGIKSFMINYFIGLTITFEIHRKNSSQCNVLAQIMVT